MSINSDLDNIYKNWMKPGEHFVKGGVVNEECYKNSNIKILVLLKEVNDSKKKENWTLVEHINDQIAKHKFYPTWRQVGIWSYGIQYGFPRFNEIGSSSEIDKNIAIGLTKIAATNLKKSGGSGSSIFEEIMVFAQNQKDLWVKEIELMKPDLVICGGTFEIVQAILGFSYQTCDSGANYGKELNTTFLDFYHPTYRVSPRMLYAYLKESMMSLGYK